MNKYIVLYFLCFSFLSIKLNSQTFVNRYSKESIPFVHLVSTENELTLSCDINGILVTANSLNEINIDSFQTSHINYRDTLIASNDLYSLDTIFLTPRLIELQEIFVVAPKNNKQIKQFKAFTRSGEFNNGSLQNYLEANVNYFINHKNNISKKFEIDQIRIFENKYFAELTNKKQNVVFGAACIPSLDKKLFDSLFDKGRVKYYDYQKNQLKIWVIDKIEGIMSIYEGYVIINIIDSTSLGEINFMGMNRNLLSKKYTCIFSVNSKNQIDLNFSNLEYAKVQYEYLIKFKKNKNEYKVESFNEIFKIDFQYIDSLKGKQLEKYTGLSRESVFHDEFWVDVDNDYFTALPSTLQNYLLSHMTLK